MQPSKKKSRRQPPAAPQPALAAGDYRRTVILVLFLISGATALAYEVVWVRMLTLVFGATVLSVGSVLAAYMAGLALGAWFWSPRADQTARPLRMYALLELGVAGSALLTLVLFPVVQAVYRALFVGGLSDFSALSLARFVLCLPVLLLPTFLMGGTLPVLARFYTSSMARIGRGAGDLYAVNTFGAVLGTLLAGFAVIPSLGVKGTLVAAVVLNVLIAAVAYRLSRVATPGASPFPVSPTRATRRWKSLDPGTASALVGFALSGFAAMALEVAWTRALIQIFGNSTYAFTTMLAAFLIGLAAGTAVCGRLIDRARYPFFTFAMLELAIGVWAAVATPLIQWLPPVFLNVYRNSEGSFGALLAGFVLLPKVGLELSILVAAALNLLVCAGVLAQEWPAVSFGVAGGAVGEHGASGAGDAGRAGGGVLAGASGRRGGTEAPEPGGAGKREVDNREQQEGPDRWLARAVCARDGTYPAHPGNGTRRPGPDRICQAAIRLRPGLYPAPPGLAF